MREDFFDTKYPRLGITVFFLSVAMGFFGSDIIYRYLCGIVVPRFDWWVLKASAKTAIFILYLVPLAIGVLLGQSKYAFFQIVALFFLGVGTGAVFKIALVFTGIINPFRF